MPIPFHDAEEIDALGAAAFLHVVPARPGGAAPADAAGGADWLGALFFINARGEPLEFAHNRIALMGSLLWRPADREQAAVRRLAMTLFQAATLTPAFLLCRAGTVGPHLFGPGGQLSLDVPVGRVAAADEAVGYTGAESQERVATADGVGQACEAHVFWTPGPPAVSAGAAPANRAAAALFARLARHGLLFEPFERAENGLREVYGDLLPEEA